MLDKIKHFVKNKIVHVCSWVVAGLVDIGLLVNGIAKFNMNHFSMFLAGAIGLVALIIVFVGEKLED